MRFYTRVSGLVANLSRRVRGPRIGERGTGRVRRIRARGVNKNGSYWWFRNRARKVSSHARRNRGFTNARLSS